MLYQVLEAEPIRKLVGILVRVVPTTKIYFHYKRFRSCKQVVLYWQRILSPKSSRGNPSSNVLGKAQ